MGHTSDCAAMPINTAPDAGLYIPPRQRRRPSIVPYLFLGNVPVFLVLLLDFCTVQPHCPCAKWVNPFDGLSFFTYAPCRLLYLFVATPLLVADAGRLVAVSLLTGNPVSMMAHFEDLFEVLVSQFPLVTTFIVVFHVAITSL